MKTERSLFSPGNTLCIAVFLLALCGILTVLSGESTWKLPVEPAIRQSVHLAVALVALGAAWKMPRSWFSSPSGIWSIGVIGWLFLALLGVFGTRINGMCGWYRCGFLSIQPAEIAKGVYLGALCAALTQKERSRRFPTAVFVAAVWIIPILMQPDFTTAVIYFGVFAMLCFLVGISRIAVFLLTVIPVGAAFLYAWKNPYAWRRFAGFLMPDSPAGYHIRQFELTVSRGGWFGSRLGHAVWSNAYLPFAYNDSAYATLAETLGFFGTLLVWALFFVVIALLFAIGRRPGRDDFSRLYIEGAALWIAFQGLLHVSVNLALIPPTGLTLPFISYGGSSLVGFFLMTGWALAAGYDAGNEENVLIQGEEK